jgi:hypothetical protein
MWSRPPLRAERYVLGTFTSVRIGFGQCDTYHANHIVRGHAAVHCHGNFSDNSTRVLQSVIWSSSNTAGSTISNDASNHGVALALANGTTTIKATAGSITGSTVLTVQ